MILCLKGIDCEKIRAHLQCQVWVCCHIHLVGCLGCVWRHSRTLWESTPMSCWKPRHRHQSGRNCGEERAGEKRRSMYSIITCKRRALSVLQSALSFFHWETLRDERRQSERKVFWCSQSMVRRLTFNQFSGLFISTSSLLWTHWIICD